MIFLCRLKPEPVSVIFLFTITLSGLAMILGPCLAATPPAPAIPATLIAPTPIPVTSTALATSMTRFTPA